MRRLPRPRIRGYRRLPGRRAVLRICAWAEVIVLSQCRISLDDTDKRISNAIQMDFPLVQKPFDELGKSLGLKEEEVISRIKRLQKEGAISLEALQRSRAQRDAMVAQVKSIEEKVKALRNVYQAATIETSYAQLSSPLDGVIAKRLQEPGDLAVPGRPVLKVEGLTAFKVVVQIPQVDMSLMKKGGRVILSEGQGKIDAYITRVYPAVTAGTMVTIEIDVLPRPFGIPSGGSVGVDVTTGKTDPGIVVPLNALLENRKGSFIYKVENGRAKIIFVQVLGKNSETASVKGDIKNGEMVVLGDEGKLLRIADGMSVVPQKVREGMR